MKHNNLSYIAPAAALVTAMLIIALTAQNPVQTAFGFFTAVFTSPYYFGVWLNTAALLITAGTGAVLALQSGNINLGGESQIYIGGFCAAVIMNALLPAGAQTSGFFSFFLLLAAACTAAAAASLTASAAAVLKIKRHISELISSFLLGAALIPIIDYTVSGPLRDKTKNLLALPLINEKLYIPDIPAFSPLNSFVFFAIPIALCAAYFLYKTAAGYKFRISGSAEEFALYCAYPVRAISIGAMSLSGAFHGLTGFFAVAGIYHTCHSGFYAGMGWNALSAALIARAHPAALIPASFFLSYIFTGISRSSLSGRLSFDSGYLIQGAIILLISASFTGKKKIL
ncbi:MAG: ABC transporter permease [Treponema lecithinolyticum]|uniref:ABC transporter permease n=1 Tax=Treponema lecithinolyticum TaxID=53418 RepID=UPI003FA2B7CE